MRPCQCDQERIKDFFRDETLGWDMELTQQLDACESCRDFFDSQAAHPEQWSEAHIMLQSTEFDVASSPSFSGGGERQGGSIQPQMVQMVLDSLAPSDNAHRLGRLSGYEVSGVVGVGGMGVVLKAIDPTLDRVVAIKVMAPHLASNATARKRFAREAKAAAAVLHPNVVPIHSVSSETTIPFLVMAFIRGGSLQKRLDREGPLSTVEILRIGSQAASGLAVAHEQGLVHRDIKPENILLEEGVERVSLTDFGLARAVDDVSVTREGTIAGTPQYMSPGQARGESVDQKSDLFSLGSVLYTLCTGRPPFRADSSYGVMRRISDASPTPIRELNPEIPDWLESIINKLMAKEKTERYESAREVHELIEACLNHVQQPDATQLPPQLMVEAKPMARVSRRPVFTVLALGTFLLAFFAAVVFYLQTNHGVVRVEVLDEALQVSVDDQTISLSDGNKEPIKLRPGTHHLIVRHGDVEFLSERFEVRRNGSIAFRAELLAGDVVLSKEGKIYKSKAVPDTVSIEQPATANADNREAFATAIANRCEVAGRFTAEQAEIEVKNPTGEALEVSFYFQVVYQSSHDRDDLFQLTGGFFKETIPPRRQTIKRVDTLLDPNISLPRNYLKDTRVIRIFQTQPKELVDIAIDPSRKLDITETPVAIASQATPGSIHSIDQPSGAHSPEIPLGPGFRSRPGF